MTVLGPFSSKKHDREISNLVPFDLECARVFGSIKSNLRALGKPTGEVDALIAATAIVHQAYSQ